MSQFNQSVIAQGVDSPSLYARTGRVYGYTYFTPSLPSNTDFFICLETADKSISLNPSVSTVSNITQFNLFEGGAFSGGTPILAVNLNRNFKDRPLGVAGGSLNPTVTDIGTKFGDFSVIGGNVRTSSPFGLASTRLILAPNTVYILEVQNDGANQADYFFSMILTELE